MGGIKKERQKIYIIGFSVSGFGTFSQWAFHCYKFQISDFIIWLWITDRLLMHNLRCLFPCSLIMIVGPATSNHFFFRRSKSSVILSSLHDLNIAEIIQITSHFDRFMIRPPPLPLGIWTLENSEVVPWAMSIWQRGTFFLLPFISLIL